MFHGDVETSTVSTLYRCEAICLYDEFTLVDEVWAGILEGWCLVVRGEWPCEEVLGKQNISTEIDLNHGVKVQSFWNCGSLHSQSFTVLRMEPENDDFQDESRYIIFQHFQVPC